MMVQQDLSQVMEILLLMVDEKHVLGMIVDEPLVFDEQPVLDMIGDERVLYKILVMEEMCIIVEELVKAVGDTVMDCIKVDDCCSMEVCCRCSWSARVAYDSAMSYTDSFRA
ncbi:hypothetical protein Tco_1001072 [Tanacetum coccineum]